MESNEQEQSRSRILYVSTAAAVGGAEKSLLDLVDCLDRTRFEPVVALPGDGTLEQELASRGVPCATAPFRRFKRTLNPFRLGLYSASWQIGSRALARVADEFDARLVHANGDTAQIYAYPLKRRCGIPIVWHVRDMTALRRLRRKMAFSADRIIAISRAVRDMLVGEGLPEAKIRVILNGIDTKPFESVPLPEAGPPTVGIIANYYPWKGHEDFLRVAAKTVREVPDARFVIVGADVFGEQPGYEQALLELRKDLGLEHSVAFQGFSADVPSVLRDWHVVAVPSHGEPFGRCVVEGLAAGRPVVAWKLAGPAEIIEDGTTGRLVKPYDIDDFARVVIGLLKEAETAKTMGVEGRKVACERFHRSRTAREVQEVYEELLG
jgi:glycosyltransferase involved in cell wall biosynthesis